MSSRALSPRDVEVLRAHAERFVAARGSGNRAALGRAVALLGEGGRVEIVARAFAADALRARFKGIAHALVNRPASAVGVFLVLRIDDEGKPDVLEVELEAAP